MLTTEEQLAKLLACAIYQLGGHLDVTKELLDNMRPVRLILDTETNEHLVSLTVLSNNVLLTALDGDQIVVVL